MALHDHWAEVRRLFDEASQRAGTEREDFLRNAAVADSVRAEVRSLLAWDAEDTDFLATPAALLFGSDPPPRGSSLLGTALGPWRIVGKIGQGGMGVVYRAVRDDAAFEREVALKVVGLAPTAATLDRFRLERETLARLDHPAIARLLDGGTTPDGHPYFVMELVDGVPVDRFCDEHRLDIDGRLAVFLRVCAGVQYAHQNLVVHRDLKPDNILVLADGHPKLLDFGVAKLVSEDVARRTEEAAIHSTWALTPDYGSPEQMRGEAITAASDVYSLGVLLHLLLTGTLPRRHRPGAGPEAGGAAGFAPASQVVAMEGAAVSRAANRRTTVPRLSRALRGDLDAILARALAERPGDRYATVEQLAADVDRYRHHRPVEARPMRPLYVASRFVRRHTVRVGMTAAVALLGSLAVLSVVRQSAIASAAQARSERRFNDLRELTRVFMFDVDEAIVNVPGTTRARELIVRTATSYLDRLADDSAYDPAMRRELAAGFVKVGDAQGHPTSANLGDSAGARASYSRAIAIADEVLAGDPGDVEAARTLALAHRRLADVLAWAGEKASARTHAQLSARQFSALAARTGASAEDRLQAAVGDIKMGDLLGNPNFPNLGDRASALRSYERALRALAAPAATQQDVRTRRYVGITHERLGTMHEHDARWDAAAAAYAASFEIRRALAADEPDHVDVQRDLAIAFEKLAHVARAQKQTQVAIAHYRAALARFERLQHADPHNAIAARSVAIEHDHLADALLAEGSRAEALTHLRRALAIHEALAARDTSNAAAPCDAARVADKLGAVIGTPRVTAAACDVWRTSDRLRRGREAACGPDDPRRSERLAKCAAVEAD